MEKEHFMKDTIRHRFEVTLKNCQTYEQLGLRNNLMNEIGVLRGVHYCMDLAKTPVDPDDEREFFRFIEIQQKMKDALPPFPV